MNKLLQGRRWRHGLLAGLLASLVLLLQPAAAAPPPAARFFEPAEFIEATLSPSGQRVAFTTRVGGERIGLYVWNLAERDKARMVARFTDVDVRSFSWVGNERLVFSVVDLAAGAGEQDAPGLYSVRSDGSEMRQLVMRQNTPLYVTADARGLRSVPLPWNHVLLHVPASGDEVIVGELHWQNNDLVAVSPKWLNVATVVTRSAESGAPAGVTRWLFDARGEARVAMARQGGRLLTYWRGPKQTEWRQIDDSPMLRARFEPRFVDADGALYVLHNEGAAATSVLSRFDAERNRPEDKPFVRTPGFDFDGTLVSDADGGKVLGARVNVDEETTVWFDPALRRVQQLADERLPGYVNRLSCRRCGAPDMVVLVRSWSARDPGHLWLYEADGSRWTLLTRVRRGVDPALMAHVVLERIATRDGRQMPVWLTVPPGRKAGDKGPAVVLVHGGPWVRGGSWEWSPMEQFLASRGYVVIAPEFRGSAGYGDAHLRAGFRQWGRAMQDDVADAARWAIDKGYADRLCIAGASYGGYSTLMGLVNDPALYRCGVAWVAVADLLLYVSGSWWVDDNIAGGGRRFALPEMVGDAEKDAAMLKAVSPLEQAARIRSPLLLAYGGRDRRVPLAHGERLRRAMRAAGQEPEWVVYDDEAHAWLKLATHVDFAQRVEAFLARHLKP